MPNRPLRPCRKLGCPKLTRDLTGYCDNHRHIYEEKKKERWNESDKNRKSASKRGYNTRWNKARKTYLTNHPLCVECMKEDKVTPATVVDHIKPHRGDMKLFWDVSNWQSLCKIHHDKKTARGE
ncbi:HNH endonuclease signature motif containing protein [Clostridium sp. Mt-5]|uniref:Putative HNH nuclease YajD n=1 Tax=Clostridium moutaii TaxID=3240932 RepID=A0ABV4BS41_9CLOT